MPIIIRNTSPVPLDELEDPEGVCPYEIRINKRVVTTYEHRRGDGLAVCLRKAADAVEKVTRGESKPIVFGPTPEHGCTDPINELVQRFIKGVK